MCHKPRNYTWGSKYYLSKQGYTSSLVSNVLLFIKWQVQYTALKDPDGNLVSADSVDVLSEYDQERIPEEKVYALYALCISVFLNLYA